MCFHIVVEHIIRFMLLLPRNIINLAKLYIGTNYLENNCVKAYYVTNVTLLWTIIDNYAIMVTKYSAHVQYIE